MLFSPNRRIAISFALVVVFVTTLATSQSCRADEPKRWAVLIGVNDYSYARDLKYCVADQSALNEQLLAAGFDRRQVTLVVDQSADQRLRPTKTNIKTQLELACGLVSPGDFLLVGFSGHGVLIGNTCYLCPADGKLDDPDSLIPMDWLYDQLKQCRADLRLVMVDACRNIPPEPEGRRAATENDLKKTSRAFSQSNAAAPEGIILLNSCSEGEFAQEHEPLGHGVFMHFLLKGLQGDADGDQNQRVTLNELFLYASDETKFYVKNKFADLQRPKLSGNLTVEALKFEVGASTHMLADERQLTADLEAVRELWRLNQSASPYIRQAAGKHLTGWRRAAEIGSPVGCFLLGWALEDGTGVPADKPRAMKLYIQAAKAGLAEAQYVTGWSSLTGDGMEKNVRVAVGWLRLAAEQGLPKAQLALGNCYALGTGVAKDDGEALNWIRRAANLGNADAENYVAFCYWNGTGTTKDEAEGLKWYQNAAEHGNATAQQQLGYFYDTGRGLPKNESEAVRWYQKAADQGEMNAQYNLATHYDGGRGVAKSRDTAVKLYRQAMANGDDRAKKRLIELGVLPSPAPKRPQPPPAPVVAAAPQNNPAQYNSTQYNGQQNNGQQDNSRGLRQPGSLLNRVRERLGR